MREAQSESTIEKYGNLEGGTQRRDAAMGVRAESGRGAFFKQELTQNVQPDGKRNLRNVWRINTASYKDAHFATFPPALVEPMVKASTPEAGSCGECGAPWARMIGFVSRKPDTTQRTTSHYDTSERYGVGNTGNRGLDDLAKRMREGVGLGTLGHRRTCEHDAPAVPPIVLDPFAGSSTTLEVARKLGCHGIGIELNPEYCKLAVNRLAQGVLVFQ